MQQAKQFQVIGKGWVWIGTSGVTSELFSTNSELAKSLEGFLGIGPSTGEGSVYLNFLSKWLEKDATKYPGIIHKLVVSRVDSFHAVNIILRKVLLPIHWSSKLFSKVGYIILVRERENKDYCLPSRSWEDLIKSLTPSPCRDARVMGLSLDRTLSAGPFWLRSQRIAPLHHNTCTYKSGWSKTC